MNKMKLNPGLITSYDLRPVNGVVTILVEQEGMDESKANEKKEQMMRNWMDKGGKAGKGYPGPTQGTKFANWIDVNAI